MSRGIHPAAAMLAASLSLALVPAAQAADAMRVVRDPVTGELRGPTAAEAAAMDKAEAQLRLGRRGGQPAQAPVIVRHADGSEEMKLGEDEQMYAVVSLGDDGQPAFNCLPAGQAQALVKGKTKARTQAKTSATAQQGDGHAHP